MRVILPVKCNGLEKNNLSPLSLFAATVPHDADAVLSEVEVWAPTDVGNRKRVTLDPCIIFIIMFLFCSTAGFVCMVC